MATITLSSNKINQMPGLIKDVKKSVNSYKSELFTLKSKALTINNSVCNMDDVISSIQSSSQTQEQKVDSLDNLSKNIDEFVSDVVRIDGNVADTVNKRKDDFYDEFSYLKPECEKSGWEKFKDGCKKVAEWCKEHWKEILIIIGAVLVIASVILSGGTALVPLLTLLGMSAKLAIVISIVISSIALIWSGAILLGYTLDIIGKIFNNNKLKTYGFALHHPIIAMKIGVATVGKGDTNISTNSSRFANAFGFEENVLGFGKKEGAMGSEVNAYRHTIWIAVISNKWGEDIALRAGNAHEVNQNALNGIDNVYTNEFKSLEDADQAIDLLNNVIGREFGSNNVSSATFKDIAKDVLDYYHEQGLNVAKKTDGGYIVIKEKLSDKRYQDALNTLETLDQNGFPPGNKYYNEK